MRKMVARTLTRGLLAVGLVAIIVVVIVLSWSSPTAAKSCTRSSDYGTQCETISGHGLTVTNVEAQLTTFADFFTQLTWAFETTTYRCDPRGRPKSECPPAERRYGTLHRPNSRSIAVTACTSEGAHIGGTSCSGRLLFSVPRTFSDTRWICLEAAVWVKGKWVDNGAGLSSGLRACRQVH